MYELYDDMPIGVIILENTTFNISYINSKFKNIFYIDNDALGSNLSKIEGFKNYNTVYQILKSKCNKKIVRINLVESRYFDLMLKYEDNSTHLFIYETTEYLNRELEAKEDREKFLNIWSEMKTKCDILEKLRLREKEYLVHLKNVINHLSEGLIVLNEFGDVDFLNRAALDITGLSSDRIHDYRNLIKGLNVYQIELNNCDVNLEEIYIDYLKKKSPLKDIIVKINANNTIKFVEVNCTPVIDESDKLINSIVTIKDITQVIDHKIELEIKNEELEKVTRMKDDFFNIMSHELRTPLTIIHSSIQLARDVYDAEITENIDKILLRITQNSRRLLKLINNILDISKAEAGFLQLEHKSFDIVAATENLVSSANLYAKSKAIDLLFDTTEEEAVVSLDRDKYEKVVLNLLSNAIKFTPKDKNILVTNVIEENYFQVRVKDEGIGIPKNKIHRIFDRFIQVDNSLSKYSDGTGLGLSLVKKLVELMGGTIRVESQEGKGTEFIVQLPKNKPNEEILIENSCQQELNNNKIIIEFSDVS
jgi:PAS domain S-box-containing protein